MSKTAILIGAPVQCGTGLGGCLMGPDALRIAGLAPALKSLGFTVKDKGNITPEETSVAPHANPAVHHLAEVIGWTKALSACARNALADGHMPIFLGGDHSLAAGSVSGVTAHAAAQGREQFVLWLDAHPDFHTLDSTQSGNLHGTPVAYFTGHDGFAAFPPLTAAVKEENICMMGIRSVDPAERAALEQSEIQVHDMRQIDEYGVAVLLRAFLDKVVATNGYLHVSLDVDFLTPEIAPAVGTTVPGGATFREAHLIMEMLHDSGMVTSLDIVELNPFLDERGRTATLMVDLVSSLMGKKVLDRPTRRF